MRSIKLAFGLAILTSAALAQSLPSPTFNAVTANSASIGNTNPKTTTTYGLGTSLLRWNSLYSATGNFTGTVTTGTVLPQSHVAYNVGADVTRWGTVYTYDLNASNSLTLSGTYSGTPGATTSRNPITLNFGALNNTGFRNIGIGPTCNVNSTSYKGELFCHYSSLVVDSIAATSAAGDNQFTASFSFANGNGNVTSANAGVFAGNDNLAVVGTGWAYAVGREIDVTVYQPVTNKQAIRIVQGYPDAYQGSTQDGAIVGVNQAGPGGLLPIGWKNFIYLDTASSTIPVLNTSNGCIICVGGSQTTNSGIDISGWTFSAYAFKATGFSVDGLGKVASVGYFVGATAGVDCSGAPTGSFAVTKGIVTHC